MRSKLAVGFAAMTDAIDRNHFTSVVDGQQDTVVAHPKAVGIRACQFFDVGTPRFAGQQGDPLQDELTEGLRNRTEVLLNPLVVHELVHGLDQMVALQAGEELVVRNRAATGANSLFERFRVGQVFNEVDQFSVIDQREHDGGWPSPLVDEEPLWLYKSPHGSCESSMRCFECQSQLSARHATR